MCVYIYTYIYIYIYIYNTNNTLIDPSGSRGTSACAFLLHFRFY